MLSSRKSGPQKKCPMIGRGTSNKALTGEESHSCRYQGRSSAESYWRGSIQRWRRSTYYATNKQAFSKNDPPRTKSQHPAISLNRALNGTPPCIPSLWTFKRPSIAWSKTHCGSWWPTMASQRRSLN